MGLQFAFLFDMGLVFVFAVGLVFAFARQLAFVAGRQMSTFPGGDGLSMLFLRPLISQSLRP